METYTIKHEGVDLVIDLYPREQIEELKARVRLGNSRLNDAWAAIIKMEHDDVWDEAFQKWHLANEKLSQYCTQLKNLGFNDCLYIENGKKMKGCLEELGCRVCTSRISYWEQELMDLPGPGGRGRQKSMKL